ncbi:MAG: methyl-accepting chemotaxis protein [Gallionella sp.]|nr:methyl-accepting chemotaxis protein [Gallionella sp.]
MSVIKRKRYIVDRGAFQYRIAMPFVIVWLFASVGSTAMFVYLVGNEIEDLLWTAHVDMQIVGEIIGRLFTYTLVATFIVVLVLFRIACIYIRRKTLGPVVRMVNDLKAVAGGDLSARIVLRKRDEFKDVADVLNDFIREKHDRVIQQKNLMNDIDGELQRISISSARGRLAAEDLVNLKNMISAARTACASTKHVTASA